jgi:PAS domain-containing protein
MSSQKPLELILARNLLSSISTPAFLVGQGGTLLFYNDAAAALLGRRFEETGTMTAQEWTHEFGPVGADGTPIPYDEIPATQALRANRPFHGTFRIRRPAGDPQDIAASAIPIVGSSSGAGGASSGGIVIFWPVPDGDANEER